MKKLFQIELIKTLNNSTFKVFLILHLLLFLLLVYVLTRVDITAPGFSTKKVFMFPNVWEVISWMASWFNMLFLGIIIIVLTGNEFAFKTSRMQIMNGLSRNEFLIGKGIVILTVALWGLLIVFLTSIITGMIYTPDITFQVVFQNSQYILIYFLQAAAYMFFALLIVTLFRSNALSIMMYLLIFILIEPIIRVFFPKGARPYFPTKVLKDLTPMPEFLSITSDSEMIDAAGQNQFDLDVIGILPQSIPMGTSIALAIVYIALFVSITYWIIQKKDF
ncbi:MAG: hypothetical protein QNK30_03755 [Bacteroidales bacterium]|nr:hypothetical protein [Bacteroidales bacterium]